MSSEMAKKQNKMQSESDLLFRELDKGIDDMEAGRELPIEDAFQKITELRNEKRNAL